MLRQTFDVNVFAVVAMAQAVAPHMIKQRSGTSKPSLYVLDLGKEADINESR